MPRPRSQKVALLKAKLVAHLNDGFQRPGDRFSSAREVAAKHAVSYQTAHRVITELQAEGFLERRESSGTFVAGKTKQLRGVELWFHPRAKKSGSYGAHLLSLLTTALIETGIKFAVRWPGRNPKPDAEYFPVLWESPGVLDVVCRARRYALLLNNRPDPGVLASLIDAVTTDDFSAGVCAAEVFRKQLPRGKKFAVVAGPRDDDRSINRVIGFLHIIPRAKVFYAVSWFVEDVPKIAGKVLATKPEGVFCVNDRLAQGILKHCRHQDIAAPPLIGHDNAPVAEELDLTTIETPWDELIRAAVEVVRRRLAGYSGPARQIFLAQRPVFRLTHSIKQLTPTKPTNLVA